MPPRSRLDLGARVALGGAALIAAVYLLLLTQRLPAPVSTADSPLDRMVVYRFAPLNSADEAVHFTAQAPAETPQPVEQRFRRDPAGEPLQIDAIALLRTAGRLERVEIEIANVSADPLEGLVWFLLAPPDSPQPWTNAAYSAPEQRIELAGGDTRRLTFSPHELPTGDFELSAWVHLLDAEGERRHSDGQGINTPLYLGAPYTLTGRLDQHEGALTLSAAARSGISRAATYSMGYSIVPLTDGESWQNQQETTIFELAPAEVQTRTFVLPALSETERVFVWLHMLEEGEFRLVAARQITP